MRKKNTHLYLYSQESTLLLHSLVELKNQLIQQGRYTYCVVYMLMARCGMDTEGYFDADDFDDIVNFNTSATHNVIGIATSDISEMALLEYHMFLRILKDSKR